MKFTNTLLKGKLHRRYKRFFADIEVNNKTVVAHCPNTGSMMGLLDQGNEAWISEHNDPKRKLKFTLEMIKVKKRIIGVNTHRANRIVEHALENKLIKEFSTIKNIRAEFKYSDDTRFDFLCDVVEVCFFTVSGYPVHFSPALAITIASAISKYFGLGLPLCVYSTLKSGHLSRTHFKICLFVSSPFWILISFSFLACCAVK